MNSELSKKIKFEEAYQHLPPKKGDMYWFVTSETSLSEDFIREFAEYLHWGHVSTYSRITESFAKELSEYVDWESLWKWNVFKDEYSDEFIQYCKEMEAKQSLFDMTDDQIFN